MEARQVPAAVPAAQPWLACRHALGAAARCHWSASRQALCQGAVCEVGAGHPITHHISVVHTFVRQC
jgi:hypothetical protein